MIKLTIRLYCDSNINDCSCKEHTEIEIEDNYDKDTIEEYIDEAGWVKKDDFQWICPECIKLLELPSKEDILMTKGCDKYHQMKDDGEL